MRYAFFFIFLVTLICFGADKKFTDLPYLPQAQWSPLDVFAISDVSSSSSKRTTVADFDARFGTVSSVALVAPSIFTVSGSPIVSTGTFIIGLVSQTANTFWAGPTAGTSVPTFRILNALDIPNLSASKITSGKGILLSGSPQLSISGGANALFTSATLTVSSGSLSSTTSGVTVGAGTNALFVSATVDLATATGSQQGLLSASDFNIFSNKQSTISGSAPVVVSGAVVSMPKATTSVSGYLGTADFVIFNNKQPNQYLAKGDLIAGTGAASSVVVSVGTNGQYLTASSTAAGGVAWTTAAGGGGGASITTYSASVGNTGTVASENGDFISGNCTNSAGTATCTFNGGFWLSSPNCQVTVIGDVTAGFLGTVSISSQSTGSVVIKQSTAGSGNISRDLSLTCNGPH